MNLSSVRQNKPWTRLLKLSNNIIRPVDRQQSATSRHQRSHICLLWVFSSATLLNLRTCYVHAVLRHLPFMDIGYLCSENSVSSTQAHRTLWEAAGSVSNNRITWCLISAQVCVLAQTRSSMLVCAEDISDTPVSKQAGLYLPVAIWISNNTSHEWVTFCLKLCSFLSRPLVASSLDHISTWDPMSLEWILEGSWNFNYKLNIEFLIV